MSKWNISAFLITIGLIALGNQIKRGIDNFVEKDRIVTVKGLAKMENAREAAQKFAKDSDSELGKIRRAYQGQFSIDNRDANTPYIKRIRVVTTIDYSLEN